MFNLRGFAAPYMLGAVIGIATVSTTVANKALQENEKNEQAYIQKKQEYMNNLSKSLDYVVSTESSYSNNVSKERLTHHHNSNAFDINTDFSINTKGLDGNKRTVISNESNAYSRKYRGDASESEILEQDISGKAGLLIDETRVRKEQILKSYANMKEQASKLYEDIIASKNYKFPCSVINYKQDVWNRNFNYNRIDDFSAQLSFNLPWKTSVNKVYPMSLPALPVDKEEIKDFILFSSNGAFLVTNKGNVWVTGKSDYGHLGLGNTTRQLNWIKTSLTDIKSVEIGSSYTAYAVTNGGEVWVSGRNQYGQLGLGDFTDRHSWEKTSLTGIEKVSSDGSRAYAITNTGGVWVAGRNNNGDLGVGSVANKESWVETLLTDVKEIPVGGRYALTNSGEVWVTGYNSYKMFGIGNSSRKLTWEKTSLSDVKELVNSSANAYAITNAGKVFVAGSNSAGSLGLGAGNTGNQDTWTETSLTNIAKVFISNNARAFALTNTGKVWVAGYNPNGQLGVGNTDNQYDWVETTLSNVKEMSVGNSYSSHAVTTTGDVWFAGYNDFGSAGMGSIPNQLDWLQTSLSNVEKIVKDSYDNVYALTKTGELWFAGRNNSGQAGKGNTSRKYSWVQASLSDVKDIKNGSYSTMIALTNNGELWGVGSTLPMGIGSYTTKRYWTKSIGDGATDISGAVAACP